MLFITEWYIIFWYFALNTQTANFTLLALVPAFLTDVVIKIVVIKCNLTIEIAVTNCTFVICFRLELDALAFFNNEPITKLVAWGRWSFLASRTLTQKYSHKLFLVVLLFAYLLATKIIALRLISKKNGVGLKAFFNKGITSV